MRSVIGKIWIPSVKISCSNGRDRRMLAMLGFVLSPFSYPRVCLVLPIVSSRTETCGGMFLKYVGIVQKHKSFSPRLCVCLSRCSLPFSVFGCSSFPEFRDWRLRSIHREYCFKWFGMSKI